MKMNEERREEINELGSIVTGGMEAIMDNLAHEVLNNRAYD